MRVLPDMTCGFWEEPAVEPYISSNPFNQPRHDKTHPTTFPDIEVKRLEEPTQPTKTSLQRDSKLRRCEGCIRVLSKHTNTWSKQKDTWLVVSKARLYHMTLLFSYWLLRNWRLLPCQRAILVRGLQNNTFPLVREIIKNLTKINDVIKVMTLQF